MNRGEAVFTFLHRIEEESNAVSIKEKQSEII